MRVSEIRLKNFKRFTDLWIINLKQSYRLIIILGPNGSGKSSLFDAFITWLRLKGGLGMYNIKDYYEKDITIPGPYYQNVHIDFFENTFDQNAFKKSIYVRTAYRNQDDFTVSNLSRFDNPTLSPRIGAMINNDAVVSENYQRLVSSTLDGVFNEKNDGKKVKELREELIGKIRSSLKNIFNDIELASIGDPLQNGSFYFKKGVVQNFHYKNLSGGEKSVFDLILDIIIKSKYFDNSIFCIDEPEAHMHTDLQAKLLRELYNIIPENSQLWISSHSIGMLNEARRISKEFPDSVAFLDFEGCNFDEPTILEPVSIESSIWSKFLKLTLGDFSHLLEYDRIFLCEGNKKGRKYKDFDAQCYNKIFSNSHYTNKFISIGNSIEIEDDNNPIKIVLEELFKKDKIVRLVDRDDKSFEEIQELNSRKIKVLKRRHIESYLFEDEILTKLCTRANRDAKSNKELISQVIEMKNDKLRASVERGNPIDDIKSAAGDIYVEIKRILDLTACGNTLDAFIRDTLVPLFTEETNVFKELEKELFS